MIRLRLLADAYISASGIRASKISFSSGPEVQGPTLPSTVGRYGLPFQMSSGSTGANRPGPTSMVAVPSATAETIFMPVQSPTSRDIAMPCRPRSRLSCTFPGWRVGMCRSAIDHSDDDGRVDDLQAGSSPTSASTPP
ncbi:unannotated protein [freshwater metagenome]|uniref:Unannotated protein n=1 Tax=freshwater metagenome TaxID=449393 RepID=A0A6J7EGU5_9ZZZZ